MKRIAIAFSALVITGAYGQDKGRDIQFWRPYDQRGINIFETSKEDTVPYDGLKVRLGGNFTQQFQMLNHSNNADPVLNADKVNTNQLIEIGPGFNLATANLNIDVLLADGISMNLITYLSSRHHPETWVKGGYLQFDKLGFLNSGLVDNAMEFLTLKVGHMEINYGDAHFRRTDNGNAFYNPFVGNYIMDAFTTEIGAELYLKTGGFLAMLAATGGEIQGGVHRPKQRGPSLYGKLGYDNMFGDNFRFRLTGSVYTTDKSISNTLYSGDRAGSRYYLVMENQLASTAANFTSGRFNPGFRNRVTAFVINPFVKFYGIELLGNLEQAMGSAHTESETRTWTQLAADLVYRFGSNEDFFVGLRYNTLSGKVALSGDDVAINRIQAGAGWFVTRNILAKMEYVQQEYDGFNSKSIFHGGQFRGVMIEGAIAF